MSSTTRAGYIAPWPEVDRDHLARLAASWRQCAPTSSGGRRARRRVRLEWSLLLVYPGQTFDTAIAVDDPTDVETAVGEFHRINAEARLIEARAQEPVVRGVRLTAIGEVEPLAQTPLTEVQSIKPTGQRTMWVGDAWHDAAVYDIDAVRPGVTVSGPAAIVSPFTTVILGPAEHAKATPTEIY